MLYIIFYAAGKTDSDCFDNRLLTVVSVYVNIIVRVIVIVVVVASVNVLPEQVSDFFVRGRKRIVCIILFLIVLVLAAILILQLGNKRVRVDIFI